MVCRFSAQVRYRMVILKICSKCKKEKEVQDFYSCAGKWRSECKKCTIKRNVKYQRRVRAWRTRYGGDDERREYMRTYYAQNKDKFAEYRKRFVEKYPDYYTQYCRRKKEK